MSAQTAPYVFTRHPERGVTHWDWTLTPILDNSGCVTSLVLALVDVSTRTEAIETLGESERQLSELNRSLEERVSRRTVELIKAHEFTEAVLDTVGLMVVVLDHEGRIVRFNKTCESVTGYRASEAEGRFVWDFLLTDEEREPVQQVFAGLRAGHFPNTHENFWVTRTGEQRLIAWANTAITDEAGNVSFVIATGTDITERRRAEDALRQSENNFRQLAENIRETFFMRDLTTNRMLYVSPSYETLWGRSVEALMNDPLDFHKAVHPEDQPRILEAARRVYTGMDPIWFNEEYRIVQPDGSLRLVWVRTFPILDQNKKPYRVAGLIQDITERRRIQEERLEYARAQRDTLVREVHHRIKNNLQGVVGLLRSHAVREPAMREAMDNAIAQVGTMALVHGLQAHQTSERVALCDLTESIVRQVVSLTGTTITPRVTRQVLRPVPLATEEAVPVALILNELLVNAVKHGMPEQPIDVTIDCRQGWVMIRIRNRAITLPAGLDIARGRGLGTGLSLVRALLPAHSASVSLSRDGDDAVAELRLAPPWVELPVDCA